MKDARERLDEQGGDGICYKSVNNPQCEVPPSPLEPQPNWQSQLFSLNYNF